jgi:hypothetical protein
MGIEYAILNRKDKTFYWLGKGPWLSLEVSDLKDQEYLELLLKEDAFQLEDPDSFYYADRDIFVPMLKTLSVELASSRPLWYF